MTEPTPDPTGATVPLDALLELSRSAGEDTVRGVLESVAHTIFQVAGFGVVVLNVYPVKLQTRFVTPDNKFAGGGNGQK